jgi:hypothetical protein
MHFSHIEPLSRVPYPYTELQEKCLQDLETTDAKQAHGALHVIFGDGSEGFCCLGRFCVVAGVPRHDQGMNYRYGENEIAANAAGLPRELVEALKLRDLGGFKRDRSFPLSDGYNCYCSGLSSMNDSGKFSFKEIAAYIRHDPWNVFTDPVPAEAATVAEVAA